MYCICCKLDKVKPNDSFGELKSEEEHLWGKETRRKKEITINNKMVDDGIIHIIDAGYGSKHDGDRIILAICDECIEENLKDATLLYFDNYMFKSDLIDNEIEKSKRIYKRRKNLDGLV